MASILPAELQRLDGILKLAHSKFSYYTFHVQGVNGIGADKAARMRMIHVVCAFVIRLQQKSGFLASRTKVYPHAGKSYCFKHTSEWGKSKLGGVL